MKRVYIDMVADLTHIGHVSMILSIKEMFPRSHVVVGIHSDRTVESYKRKPVLKMTNRAQNMRRLRNVSEVVEDAPLIVTDPYVVKHKIDVIVFGEQPSHITQKHYGNVTCAYMVEMPRTPGISSTKLIEATLAAAATRADEHPFWRQCASLSAIAKMMHQWESLPHPMVAHYDWHAQLAARLPMLSSSLWGGMQLVRSLITAWEGGQDAFLEAASSRIEMFANRAGAFPGSIHCVSMETLFGPGSSPRSLTAAIHNALMSNEASEMFWVPAFKSFGFRMDSFETRMPALGFVDLHMNSGDIEVQFPARAQPIDANRSWFPPLNDAEQKFNAENGPYVTGRERFVASLDQHLPVVECSLSCLIRKAGYETHEAVHHVGPSTTVDLVMRAARLMGFSRDDLYMVQLTMIAAMLPMGSHSILDIVLATAPHGLRFPTNDSLDDHYQSLLPECLQLRGGATYGNSQLLDDLKKETGCDHDRLCLSGFPQ